MGEGANCTRGYRVVGMVAYIVVMSEHCCHERRGLMAKKKIVCIFGRIIPLLMPPHPLAFLHCRGALRGSKRLQHSSEWWWCPPYAPRFSKMELRRNGWQVQPSWIPAAQTALQDRQDRPAPMLDVTPTPARGRMCAIILTPANADASASNP